eukprot:PhF_6_TR42799/c0_g1_i1/m.64772
MELEIKLRLVLLMGILGCLFSNVLKTSITTRFGADDGDTMVHPIEMEPSCATVFTKSEMDFHLHQARLRSRRRSLMNTEDLRRCTPFITSSNGYWSVGPSTSSTLLAGEFVEPTCHRRSNYTRFRLMEMLHGKQLLFYGHSHLRNNLFQLLDCIGFSVDDEEVRRKKHFSWVRNVTNPEGYFVHITFVFVGLFPPDQSMLRYFRNAYDIAYVA